MYASLLDAYIPADAMVQAFVGYSWGGEQAYCVAQRWQKIRGTTPTVYLGDSHMNNRSMFRKIKPEDVSASIIDNVRKRNDVCAQTPEDKIRKEIAKILNRNNHVVDRLMSGFVFPNTMARYACSMPVRTTRTNRPTLLHGAHWHPIWKSLMWTTHMETYTVKAAIFHFLQNG